MAFAPGSASIHSMTSRKTVEGSQHAQVSFAPHTAWCPSIDASTAPQFDQYSEYSGDDSDCFARIKASSDVKSAERGRDAKCSGRRYEEMTMSCGEDDLFHSADEATDFEPTKHEKRAIMTGESSTDVPPSGAELRYVDSDSDDDGFRHEKPKFMTPFVYPITMMLKVRSWTAATTFESPTSKLCMKKADEVAQEAPAPRVAKSKRQFQARPGLSVQEDKVTKSVRSILNNLTADSIDGTLEKLSGAGLQTVPQLVILIHEVVEKACVNQHLAGVCADLCVRIKSHRKFRMVAGGDGEPSGFRQLLLDECWPRCQQLIRRSNKESAAESFDKRQSIGNVKLMGELMARGLVSPRLLINLAEGLLNAYCENSEALETLEALMVLLTAACPRLDLKQEWVHADRMDAVFCRLREMVRKQSAPLAVRLLVKDVISLRDNWWRFDGAAPQTDQFRICADRSVEREPPKPKQMHSPVEQTVTGARGMLSLAREMLLAPVEAPRRTTLIRQQLPVANGAQDSKGWRSTPGKESTTKESTSTVKESSIRDSKAMLAKKPALPKTKLAFNPIVFHREVSVTLRNLGSDGNITSAIQRIIGQNVPVAHQATEYADLLTRIVEIARKAVRHAAFAFAAGLVKTAFDETECIAGVKVFFDEVFADLCEDVPQLPSIIRAEFLPTLQSAFPKKMIEQHFPENL